MIKKLSLFLIVLSIVSFSAFSILAQSKVVYAQTLPCVDGQGPLQPGQQYCSKASDSEGIPLENPIKATSVPELVNSIVRSILGMVGALALFMFVYGGMLWMTSAGNNQRIEKGKETLIWATIGLAIIFASYGILQFIFQALSGKG